MSRNNQDRLGSPLAPDQPLPPQVMQEITQQTGLSYVAPVELVDLPSKGKFYPQDHPLHNQEQIEIRHMTAKDEDILVNQSYLKKGIAIDKLLESVITNKAIRVSDLLVGDKNAIVIATRISGYGPEYEAKIACPSCGTVQEKEFDLEEASVYTDASEETTEGGTFVITLPKTGAVVEVRPLTGLDEAKMVSSNSTRKKQKLPPMGLTDQMKMYVKSVTIDSNPVHVSDFIDNMPAIDSRYLRTQYKNSLPNVELAQHFECINCGYEQVLEVPFTTDFFWPKQ